MGFFERLATFPQIFDNTSAFCIKTNVERNEDKMDSILIGKANSSPSGSPDEMCAAYILYKRYGFEYVSKNTNISDDNIRRAIDFVEVKLREHERTFS